MPSKFLLLLLLSNIVVASHAQNYAPRLLNIGSPAPPLHVREWLKGKPIAGFEKGKVYVVEFWSTWCGPCIEEMPRLSELARKYKGKVTVLGINIYERKTNPEVRAFVDSMAHWMDYNVAAQDSNFMETEWMDAIGQSTIPTSFVVDKNGRIAWVGYTANLANPLSKIADNNWDLVMAKEQWESEKRIAPIGNKICKDLLKFTDNRYMMDFYGDPDSALYFIDKLVASDSNFNCDYSIALTKFHALLRKSPSKAYDYGRILMKCPNPNYDAIINTLKDFPYQYNTLPKEIFELGAEACQAKIDLYPWSSKTAKNYFKMAEWYLLAGNKKKTKQAMKRVIKAIRRKKGLLIERSF
jgi:thiol-disulfide isomerase/thioredoxin